MKRVKKMNWKTFLFFLYRNEIFVLRLITYGSKKIFRCLTWKNEKRLAKSETKAPSEGLPTGKKKSTLGRYVPILVGSGVLGLFIVKRVHPDYRKPGKEASNWEVGHKFRSFAKVFPHTAFLLSCLPPLPH